MSIVCLGLIYWAYCWLLLLHLGHKTNLTIEVLIQLPIISGIEDMLSDIYTFFYKFPKKNLEFVHLATLLESKSNKILQKVKMLWLGMLVLAVRIFTKYKPLLVEFQQHAKVRKPKMINVNCFSHLRDVAVLLSFSCIMPVLKLANKLIKYVQ